MKSISRTYKIPIIVTINTTKDLDKREDKRPRISDLGEWEPLATNAANVVLFLYRDEVYHRDKEENKGIAEIIVAKNDYGPIDICQACIYR